jgi:hypothetical protein
MPSCILTIPANLRDKANALGEAMGWGPDNYSVALSPKGTEPATVYLSHLANAQDDFLALLEAAGKGEMPDTLDYPPEDFAAVLTALTVDLAGDPFGHFEAFTATAGLEPVNVEV